MARDAADSEVKVTTDVTQAVGQATSRSVSLAFPSTLLPPNTGVLASLCANPASGTCAPVGSASSTSPLYPAPLTGKVYFTGSILSPGLAIVFGPPFSLTLQGAVSLATNSTTFSDVPDIPLTDLQVTLNGGPGAVFQASCNPASGSATATLTSQNGDRTVTASAPFTVSGCTASSGGVPGGDGAAQGGGVSGGPGAPSKPTLRLAFLSGLASGKPTLLFQVLAGTRSPDIRSLTIALPRGLRFAGHRVRRREIMRGARSAGRGSGLSACCAPAV